MSQDVTIHWRKGKKRPSESEIKRVIEDYFGPVLRQLKWGRGRYFVYLLGSWTHPHMHVAEPAVRTKLRAQRPETEDLRQRCIEVLPSKDSLSTITRSADWFTNDCARGLAKAFSLWWDGKLEMEGSWQ